MLYGDKDWFPFVCDFEDRISDHNNSLYKKLKTMDGIGIYGYRIGDYLAESFIKHGIHFECLIDQNADVLDCSYNIVKKEQTPDNVRYVISTLFTEGNRNQVIEYYRSEFPKIQVLDVFELFYKTDL